MKGFSAEHPMKLLWLSNVPLPGAFPESEGSIPVICGWVNALAGELKKRPDIRLSVLYPTPRPEKALVREAEGIRHIGFYEPGEPLLAYPDWMEQRFREILEQEKPDLIHLWGTEYVHALSLFLAFNRPERVLISIQGLISVYAEHYFAGLKGGLLRRYTLRDLVHRDNLIRQQEKYRIRGSFERRLLGMAKHVAGRTSWDRTYAEVLAPEAAYHHCGEVLREVFYSGERWTYEGCRARSIFASQFYYPIKGFHQLLYAMPLLLKRYPDVRIRVSGGGIIFPNSLKGKLKQSAYPAFLEKEIRRLGLKDKVTFLGTLDAEGMKREYLSANVFVLPSAIENSPNSLGEAMLTGTPAIASRVGGVQDMLPAEEQLYPFEDYAALAKKLERLFEMEGEAEKVGKEERLLAESTHAPDRCLSDYLEAYGRILE